MFKRWIAFLAKHQTAPEDSKAYRLGVTILVCYALALTLHQLEWPSLSIPVLLVTPAASFFSYHRREHGNFWIKIFLSFAMIAVLFWFLMRLRTMLHDPRIPLAELLILLQTLHSFDLPAKKDLRYTVLVALILIAIACVLTYTNLFGLALMAFCGLFLGVAALDFWAENRKAGTQFSGETSLDLGVNSQNISLTLIRVLPLTLLGAVLVFGFMPRYQGLKIRSMPVNWDIQFRMPKISEGEIFNSGGQDSEVDSKGRPQRFDGDAYFGFNSEVNLNARGSLSDKLVLKVRASNSQYHRAVSFAEYTGVGWKSGMPKPAKRAIEEPPFQFFQINPQDERLTIYYCEAEMPNVVFSPLGLHKAYFPSRELFVVSDFESEKIVRRRQNGPNILIAPFKLDQGLVYSVLNQVRSEGPRQLKNFGRIPLSEPELKMFEAYIRLPETLPKRVPELALELTQKYPSEWEKASALTNFLQQQYSYNLDVDFYPQGADTADHFLFTAKEGYCEQFATTLCVMARSIGLPARYVTGYLPGTHNPFTGFYEVKASDAHAWAEIYLRGYGWMIFDPVPGGTANPGLQTEEKSGWMLESLLDYLNLPTPIRKILPTLLRVASVLALFSLILGLWFRGKKRIQRSASLSSLEPYLRQAEQLTETMETGETVKNWAERLDISELREIAKIYETTLYRDVEARDTDLEKLKSLIAQLKSRP